MSSGMHQAGGQRGGSGVGGGHGLRGGGGGGGCTGRDYGRGSKGGRGRERKAGAARRDSFGIVPWVIINGEPHALLQISFSANKVQSMAKFDPMRGRQKHGEAPWECAVREAYEESSGVLNLKGAAEVRLLEKEKLYHVRLAFAIADGADLAAATAEQVRGMIGQYPPNRAAIAEGHDMEMWAGASEVYGLGWVNMTQAAERPLRFANEVRDYVQPMVGRLDEMPVLCVQREGNKFVIAAADVGVAVDLDIPVPQLLSIDPRTLADGSDLFWDAVGRKVYRYPEDATREFADKLSSACGYNHTTEDIVSWFEHYTLTDVDNKRPNPPLELPHRPPAARVADQAAAAAEGAQLADVAADQLAAQLGAAQLDDV
jgi:hypothetical protein